MTRITLAIAFATLAVTAGSVSAQTPITIKAATVLDGKGGTLHNVAIVVQGSKIVRIEPAKADATYDLTALTVMPGWIDTHAHIVDHFNRSNGRLHTTNDPETPEQTTLYAYENAYKTFMAGFTTLQSPGNPVDKDIRDWIAEGRIPGPRILTSLRAVTDHTGNPSQIRAFVRKAVADGADFALSGPCAWTIVRLPSLFASSHAAWICSSLIVFSPPSRMLPLAKILTKSAPSSLIHLSMSARICAGVPVVLKI